MRRPSLNHAYRLVWSDITQAYVAVSEHTKSHGKRKALSVAVALALAPAMSMAQVVIPSGPPVVVTDNVNYSVDDDLNLYSSGAVYTIAAGEGISVYTETFTNNSTISVQNQNGTGTREDVFGVVAPDVAGTILNKGVISADITTSGDFVDLGDGAGYQAGSAFATGVQVGSLSGAFTNEGAISASAENSAQEGTAQAIGVALKGGIEANGTFSNVGLDGITANALSTSSTDAYAYGVSVTGAMAGHFINDTQITAEAQSAGAQAAAYGVKVDGDLSGSMTNASGAHMSAIALTLGEGSSAYANGVHIGGALSSTLENHGTISAVATADSSDANAFGVRIGGDIAIGATLNNQGLIHSEATSNEWQSAYAYGVSVSGDVAGALDNHGTISSAATVYTSSEGHANAYGINIDGALAGTLTNHSTGVITVSADHFGYSNATAYGISVGNGFENGSSLSGTLINEGTIEVTANSYDDAAAAGIYIDGHLTGTATNAASGSILVTANGSSAHAVGMSVHGDVSFTGSLINNGSINVGATAFGGDTAEAHGMEVYGNMGGTTTNAGTIVVGATSDYDAEAVGIYIDSNMTGTLSNAANASIKSTATGKNAQAAGIAVNGSVSGTLINAANASIVASATGNYAGAAGIVVYGSDSFNPAFTVNTPVESSPASGSIVNNGSIKATANGIEFAQAAGIGIQDGVAADISNTGTITASASASGQLIDYGSESMEWRPGLALASGIQVDGYMSGNISNTGTINASAKAVDGGEGSASGIWIGNGTRLEGNITNSQIINASVTMKANTTMSGGLSFDGAEGYATGIRISEGSEIYGNILNSETITASVTMTDVGTFDSDVDSAVGRATGILIEGDTYVAGNLDNHKAISADVAIADGAEGYAGGVVAYGDIYGNFNNAGTISANAHGNSALAFAEGASLYNLAGTMSNSGVIEAKASGIYAIASGVQVEQGSSGINSLGFAGPTTVVENTSTGKISATAEGYLAFANGMNVYGVDSNQKAVNKGSILATATSGHEIEGTIVSASAVATGVSIDNLYGEFENSGTIGAFAVSVADGAEGAAATGIAVSYMTGGTINNSGTVIASYAADGGEGNSITINSGEGGGTVNNTASGKLIGGIDIGYSSVTVNNDGQLILKNGVSLNNINNTGVATYGYIGGNYNQGATGVLHIAAESNQEGGYSQLEVGGTANITGKAYVDVKSVNTLVAGQILENVVSAGSLSGDFVSVADNSALFGFQSRVDGNTIDFVTIKDKTVSESVNNRGNRPGKGAATVIDNLIDSGKGSDSLKQVISEFGKLSTEAEVSEAVSQLLPLLTSGTSQSITGAVSGASRIVQARQEGQVGRSSGDGFFGDKKMWFKPFGSWADQDDRNGVSGYESDTYGMVFGIDSELSSVNRVGLAFSYSKTDVDGSGSTRQSADVDSYQLIGYGSRSLNDATDINFQAGIGLHTNKGHRDMTVGGLSGTASSKFDSWSANLGVGIAHTMKLSEATSFTPSARVDYTMIRSETYDETGRGDLAAVALEDVKSRDTEALVVGVDGKVVHALNDRASLTANIGVGYDLLNERASTTATFAGAPGVAFTTQGIDPSPWLTRGGLGVVGKITDTLELTARYDFEVREDFNNQTVSVKARWSF